MIVYLWSCIEGTSLFKKNSSQYNLIVRLLFACAPICVCGWMILTAAGGDLLCLGDAFEGVVS